MIDLWISLHTRPLSFHLAPNWFILIFFIVREIYSLSNTMSKLAHEAYNFCSLVQNRIIPLSGITFETKTCKFLYFTSSPRKAYISRLTSCFQSWVVIPSVFPLNTNDLFFWFLSKSFDQLTEPTTNGSGSSTYCTNGTSWPYAPCCAIDAPTTLWFNWA